MKSLLWLLLFTTPLFGQRLPVRLESRYALMLNAQTGGVIVEKRRDEKVYPSSTAKIATACYILHLLKENELDLEIEAPKEVLKKVSAKYKYDHLDQLPPYILQKDGTSFNVLPGERLTYRSLLYGLLVASGNDAANVLAYHLGEGSIEQFMEGLNTYLKSLGCKKTHFVNPHGLHHPEQYSTPYEMALIGMESIKHPLIRTIIKTQSYERPKTNKQKERTITQSNKLVKEGKLHFDEAYGMKTGFTTAGGYCLLSCADNGTRSVVAALFDAKEDNHRYRDAIELFTHAFEEKLIQRKLFNGNREPFTHRLESKDILKMVPYEDVIVEYYPSENPHITTTIEVQKVSIPIVKGEKVAKIDVFFDGKKVKEVDLFAAKGIKKPFNRWWLLVIPLALYIGYKARQALKLRREPVDQD